MVSEKFSFENSKFYKDVWLIYILATQQFRSFRWLIFPSILISCKELKNAQIAQVNQLFQLLNLVRIYWQGFYELSRMLMRKTINIDVSKDSPFVLAIYGFCKLAVSSFCREKPCRYFAQGTGTCPFGSSCFYKHGKKCAVRT